MPMTSRFPMPPPVVLDALNALQVIRSGDQERIEALGDVSHLPRPWLVESWHEEDREELWQWCDAVADWVNRGYAWKTAQMIPPCWTRHPHIAHELPVLAVLRWQAEESTSVDPLEEWHRYALPTFFDRLTGRLGDGGKCRTGSHDEWPASPRYHAYSTPDLFDARQLDIRRDAHPGETLRLLQTGDGPT